MAHNDPSPEELLGRARTADAEALGELLERYRNYLRFLARSLIGSALRLQLDASDLVQDSFLDAHRDFGRFTGQSEGELMAWLRQILVRNLADQARHHQAEARDPKRRESLDAMLDRSSHALHQALATSGPSPASQAEHREQAVLLADALESLPEDYREVIRLRNLERLPFEQVATQMGRTSGAVRMLWTRALERLSHTLEGLT